MQKEITFRPLPSQVGDISPNPPTQLRNSSHQKDDEEKEREGKIEYPTPPPLRISLLFGQKSKGATLYNRIPSVPHHICMSLFSRPYRHTGHFSELNSSRWLFGIGLEISLCWLCSRKSGLAIMVIAAGPPDAFDVIVPSSNWNVPWSKWWGVFIEKIVVNMYGTVKIFQVEIVTKLKIHLMYD